ncbi:MAG: hypothetical protein IJ036_05300 [Lachnospiraceae bacterium]|nr:hypothetical protein [Lachnospiraceae bacterium]
MPTYATVIGTITRITNQERDCCERMISLRTDQGTVNVLLTADTLVVDSRTLQVGMRIAAFYDFNAPVPLIYPPQYRALIIAVLQPGDQVFIGLFNRNLVSADNTLRLQMGPRTQITTGNGQNCRCCPENHTLLVIYTNSTRSIPAQTTPRRVVVIC